MIAVLAEPAVLVNGKGVVLYANGPAIQSLALSPGEATGVNLASLCDTPEDGEAFSALLHRASGTASSLPGVVTLRIATSGSQRFRCQASRIGGGGGTRVLLRLVEGNDQRFAELNRKIGDLHDEVRRRRHLQARLEEALRDRELLVRELHHRVKNNLQTFVSLLQAAEREGGKEPAAVLREVSRRLSAAGAVHQLLHQEGAIRGVAAATFLGHLGALIAKSLGAEGHLAIASGQAEIPNDTAVPLALILNELLTNAVKHGSAGGPLVPIRVSLDELEGGILELTVEDGGAGFPSAAPEAGRRASGLGLVRGLARQMGGTVTLGQSALGGARSSVRFRPPQLEAERQAGN
ncbi:sensor histidine kinase [Sabulicella glaciei]|uniref:histidine kinase n=1 Tax=Sabulicella glaciei TaxID=2984948 RepID=A0ABT3NQS8_9PROT|nr:ATP-binding protein [Roseococcus sp. MDT2-1-1]